MEAGVKQKGPGLSALFWRCLLVTGLCLVGILLAGLALVLLLMVQGVVLPANTASAQVSRLEEGLAQGAIYPEQLPHYFRWILLDREGQPRSSSPHMSLRQRRAIEQAAAGQGPVIQGILYDQYHQGVRLPNGSYCVLQYDFSVCYQSPWAQDTLPDFQITLVMVMLLLAVAAATLCTRHYARLLQRDAQALTAASRSIAARRLDQPFERTPQVRELRQTLAAMDELRRGLAASLGEQWAMEQQRQQEIAALAHDLKTPLAIIGGNGELLEEAQLTEEQRGPVEAILRSTRRLEDYVAQLQSIAHQEQQTEPWAWLLVGELFEEWCKAGQGLCGPRGLEFVAEQTAQGSCRVRREHLNRAVLNLLDNAVRFTPAGGRISLRAQQEGPLLCVTVQDSGPGFSAQALAQAEQMFYTEDAGRTGRHRGIGLYFASQTAQEHGGTLVLDNTRQGARVSLRLPFKSIPEKEI